MAVDGHVVVSSTRQIDDGIEVRLFNPAPMPVEATIRFEHGASFSQVQRVDLESRPLSEAGLLSGNQTALSVEPKQVVTLRFT